MQYVNRMLLNKKISDKKLGISSLARCCMFAGCMGLIGCASDSTKSDLSTAELKSTLVTTQVFVPVLKQDKEGVYLPYEPAVNPYAAQTSRLKKESVLTYINAQRAFDKQQYGAAEILLRQLVVDDKKLSGPWVMLGDIASKKEDYVTAKSDYEEAIRINKDNVNAYLRLALAQREVGEFILSQNTYSEALAIWPDFPEAHLNLSILYDLYLNHPIRAQEHMEAYQFLTNETDEKVAQWLKDVQSRTGIATKLKPVPVQYDEGLAP